MIHRCALAPVFLGVILTCCEAKQITLALQDGKNGYSGTRDVTTLPQEPFRDRNLGAEPRLMVSESGASILLHFDTTGVPANYILKAASVELCCIDVNASAAESTTPWEVDISLVNGEWTEGTGKIKDAPKQDGAAFRRRNASEFWLYERITASGGISVGRAILRGSSQQWYQWKLEGGFLGQPIGNSHAYAGFVLRCPPDQEKGAKSMRFASREHPEKDKRPVLRLTLEVPDEPRVVAAPAPVPVPASNPAPAADNQSGISWADFLADCGLEAQEVNEAKTEKVFREKYKGKSVRWSGIVDAVRENPFGNGFLVGIRMTPTESILGGSDLTLSAGEEFEDRVLSLNSNEKITFRGKFKSQGGRILDHTIELEGIE